MSRIGNLPVTIPAGVSVGLEDRVVRIKGPRGEAVHELPQGITVRMDGATLFVERAGDDAEARRLHGVTRAHLSNKVVGASSGHSITLVVNGKGFQGEVRGRILEMQIGFSHRVLMEIPAGVSVQVQPGQNTFTIQLGSANRELLGSFASVLYRLRPVEPYNMIGFRYSDQVVRRKAAKTTK